MIPESDQLARLARTGQAAAVEAAFAAIFPVPCGCPVHHAGTGSCENQSVTARRIGEADVPLCGPCAACLVSPLS